MGGQCEMELEQGYVLNARIRFHNTEPGEKPASHPTVSVLLGIVKCGQLEIEISLFEGLSRLGLRGIIRSCHNN